MGSVLLTLPDSVYSAAARVSWPPAKIFGDEIRIIGSFSEVHMFRKSSSSFPRFPILEPKDRGANNVFLSAQTVDYMDNGKIKTKGIVNKTFKLEQFGEALESIRNKTAIKAAIVFDD